MIAEGIKPEESEFASLRQVVEWVAFGLPPLTDRYDRALRNEGGIRLMYIHDLDSPKAQAICEAQEKIFTALAQGILPSQTVGVAEIEPCNYDRDIPDFKFIADVSGIQAVKPDLWQYDRIHWSDSSLTYDNPAPSSKSDGHFNTTWLLAKYIWVDTAKMYEVFPRKDRNPDKGLTCQGYGEEETAKTHTGDPGRPSPAHLYTQEFERLVKEKKIEKTLAEQARVLLGWFILTHPELARPNEGTIKNRIRDAYNQAKNATK